ncbi:MAG: hypothetical protein EBT03_10580 [Betaproteobacteria bacterium]|nr:hypothetical protein [Betaproteobacteria bacterium]
MRLSYRDIESVKEPDHILEAVAPYMPEGQRRQLFWGEFDTDEMVESYLKRQGIIPPVHWRVTVGNAHRDGFWENPS